MTEDERWPFYFRHPSFVIRLQPPLFHDLLYDCLCLRNHNHEGV